MLKLTAKISNGDDKNFSGDLVVIVNDGMDTRVIPTDIHCTPSEMYLMYMAETIHIVKHLYSIAEDIYNRKCPLLADVIVKRFNKTYTPNFNPHNVELFQVDPRIAEISLIM